MCPTGAPLKSEKRKNKKLFTIAALNFQGDRILIHNRDQGAPPARKISDPHGANKSMRENARTKKQAKTERNKAMTDTTSTTTASAATYILLPEAEYKALRADWAEIKAYMLRNPREKQESTGQEYSSPKELQTITGYSPSTISNKIAAARAAGVQVIGDGKAPRIHKAQFLAFLEKNYNATTEASKTTNATPRKKQK